MKKFMIGISSLGLSAMPIMATVTSSMNIKHVKSAYKLVNIKDVPKKTSNLNYGRRKPWSWGWRNPFWNYDYGQMLSYVTSKNENIQPNRSSGNALNKLSLSDLPDWSSFSNLNKNYLNNKAKYEDNKSSNVKKINNLGDSWNGSSNWKVDNVHNRNLSVFSDIFTKLASLSIDALIEKGALCLAGLPFGWPELGAALAAMVITEIATAFLHKLFDNSYSVPSSDVDYGSCLKLHWDAGAINDKGYKANTDSLLIYQLRTIVEFHIEDSGVVYTTTNFQVLSWYKTSGHWKYMGAQGLVWVPGRIVTGDVYSLALSTIDKNQNNASILSWSVQMYSNLYSIADIPNTPNGKPIDPKQYNNTHIKKYKDLHQININYTITPGPGRGHDTWGGGQIDALIQYKVSFLNSKDFNSWGKGSFCFLNSPLLPKDVYYDFKTNQTSIKGNYNTMFLGEGNVDSVNMLEFEASGDPRAQTLGDPQECTIMGQTKSSYDPDFSHNFVSRTFNMKLWIYKSWSAIV